MLSNFKVGQNALIQMTSKCIELAQSKHHHTANIKFFAVNVHSTAHLT